MENHSNHMRESNQAREALSTLPAAQSRKQDDRDLEMVARLRTAVARRHQAEKRLSEEAAQPDQSEWLAAQTSLEEQLEALGREIEDREREFQTIQSARQTQHQEEMSAIESQFRRATTEIARDAEEKIGEVERQYEENEWMLGSLLDDDSEQSPKRQYELLREQLVGSRDQLTERWEALRGRYDAAIKLIQRRGLEPNPATESAPTPGTRRDAMMGFDAGELLVLAQAERIEKQVFAQFMTPLVLGIIVLLLTGAIFALGNWVLSPDLLGFPTVQPRLWTLLSLGAGLAVAIIVAVILHAIARRMTYEALGPLQQGLESARANYSRWMGLAKDELQHQEQNYRERQHTLVARRDAAARQFETTRVEALQAIEQERVTSLVGPTQEHQSARAASEQRFQADLEQLSTMHRRAIEGLHSRIAFLNESHQADEQRRTAHQQASHAEQVRVMGADWTEAITTLEREVRKAWEADQPAVTDWAAILEHSWTPADEIPRGIRIGRYRLALDQMENGVPRHPSLSETPPAFEWPARLPFPTNPSLCLQTPHAGREQAIAILQVAMLRLLTQLPAGTLRFTVIDPVGLGESFSAFMHLADADELLISSRIWTEPSQIDTQLAKLTDHMESVFQKYLRGEYETIEEYNEEAGEVAEPYRILVIAGFPHGFSDRAAERLASILASGPRCGVFPLIIADLGKQMPNRFDPAPLDEAGTVLNWNGTTFARKGTPSQLTLLPDAPPSAGDFAAIVRKMGELSKHIRRVEVPFRRVIPNDANRWTQDSRRSLDCPLGRAGATRLQNFHLGTGTSQHVLIAGKTGSGKSTLLHVLITNLALRYGPSDLEYYLIDFKKGVEFKTYATHQLPHARVIAIESDREFAVSVLERLDRMLKERGDLFRDVGVQDIKSFRNAQPNVAMPRVLLIVDEFQEFFTEDDKFSQAAALLLDRLVRQGRAFGMHVLLGSQTLGGAYSLARTTIGQMAVRIALQCSEADAHLILSEENSAARLLTRPGEAIYNDANGLLEGNSPFQIAWLSEEEQSTALRGLAELAREQNVRTPPMIVFEGNVPADPARNDELTHRIQSTRERQESLPLRTWIGEAVAITGPAEIDFPRHSGANLLVVGPDAIASKGVLTAAIAGLAATQPAATPADDSPSIWLFTSRSGAEREDRWGALAQALGARIQLGGAREANDVLVELASDLEQRKTSDTKAPDRLVIFDDFGHFRDLRKSDDDFSFGGFDREKTVKPSQHFAELLKDGPAHGIHLLVWCDTYNNVDRGLGRQLIREFEQRIVFQMSPSDSSNLIDSPAAGRIGANRAILYRDDRGTTEKFRPYRISDEWLAWMGQTLHGTTPPASSEPLEPEPLEPEPSRPKAATPRSDEAGTSEPDSNMEEPKDLEEAGQEELDTWNIS